MEPHVFDANAEGAIGGICRICLLPAVMGEHIADPNICPRCGGTGNELLSWYKKCTECYGTGKK